MCEDYLQGLNQRKDSAWKAFYTDYYSALCAYACKFLKISTIAEDVVQETCVKIWEGKNEFSLHERLLQNIEVDEFVMPEEAFVWTVREELIRQLHIYIEELPEEARKIVKLTLEGLSGKEIAEKLNISIHTVKSQKNRSFKFLREKLSGSYYISMLYILFFEF